ncbi:MT-A70 family methyltransferase [Roseospirillum parvum]|uniref:N6-adenosine-specific RNA methylase IME4 n=2 Tax=Roseospirillum parvum TaxID=83401 RepID=A0A1G8GHW5_9PROT|nr:MT-A70 family methyltransferase [Roseospirillum parvum]SDH93978.1 N6-adenosine-specific RNA methylase IME4 [Roseospirillum parvum]
MTDCWPFGHLRPLAYSLIYADPPWLFANYSSAGEAKNPLAHYACMGLDQIQALPVGHLAAPDCLLAMWATFPMLPQALETLAAWGFTYKTGGAWHKRTTGGKTAFGTGYVLRSAAEVFLIGTMGRPRLGSRSERNLVDAPTREHSRKPDEMAELLSRLVPDGRRVELFARETRPGWDCWGDQVSRFGEAS